MSLGKREEEEEEVDRQTLEKCRMERGGGKHLDRCRRIKSEKTNRKRKDGERTRRRSVRRGAVQGKD